MVRIAFKDMRLFLADRRALLLTFIVPIALITLFALAFGGSGDNEARRQSLPLVDEDQTDASKGIATRIDSLRGLDVHHVGLDEGMESVRKGKEAAVLILHRGLKDSLDAGKNIPIELRYDAAKEGEIGLLNAALMGNLMRIVGIHSFEKRALAQFDKNNPDLDSATRNEVRRQINSNFKGSERNPGSSMLTTTAIVAEKETSPGLIQAVAGTSIMMLLFTVGALGASLLDEKQEGTLKRLLSSPLSPSQILFGKMLSSNLVCVLQLSVMFLYARLVFGLDIFRNPGGLIIMIVATGFACSSFGMFLASFAKSRSQVQGLTTLLVLTMSAVGGSMVPLFLMPAFMQKMAYFSVNYWGIQGFYDLFWRMLPVSDPTFLQRIVVLLLIGFVLNAIALRMFKRNALAIA
jgi:ABC-2 type transport system permease protein